MFLAFLSSLFLRAAEEEAAAGASGSKGLRVGALRALRLLFAAADNGDALAFILPGVVSRLARALLLAGKQALGGSPGFGLCRLFYVTFPRHRTQTRHTLHTHLQARIVAQERERYEGS